MSYFTEDPLYWKADWEAINSINGLGLPIKARNGLYNAGISLISEVEALTERELLRIPGIGILHTNKIRSALIKRRE
jgi:DNA-directed RNA polymerase alpha subunit